VTEESITAREAAALIVFYLQRRGAVFSLNRVGSLRVDLDGAGITDHVEAESWSRIVLSLAAEIKQLLRADRTAH
jgi:hypothetical protein